MFRHSLKNKIATFIVMSVVSPVIAKHVSDLLAKVGV